MPPYQYCLDKGVKVISPQFNFLRPSMKALKTDKNDTLFLSIAQKSTHRLRLINFVQHEKPQNSNSSFTKTLRFSQ